MQINTLLIVILFSVIVSCSKAEDKKISLNELKDNIKNGKNYIILDEEITEIKKAKHFLSEDGLIKFYEDKKYSYGSPFFIWNKNKLITKASSILENNTKYSSENVSDSNPSTVWAEGVKGFGYKEWLKVEIDSNKDTFTPIYIIIFPGHGGGQDLFNKNNRLKSAVVQIYNPCGRGADDSDGKPHPIYIYERLQFDDINKYHIFPIVAGPYAVGEKGKPIEITLYIESVYKGSKYDDTCIGEFFVLGREDDTEFK